MVENNKRKGSPVGDEILVQEKKPKPVYDETKYVMFTRYQYGAAVAEKFHM